MEFWKKENNKANPTAWREDALRLANEKPYVRGRVAEILNEMRKDFPSLRYDQVRMFLRVKGFKTHDRSANPKRINRGMFDWEREALSIAQPMKPLGRGDMKIIFKTLSEKYPEVRYDMMTYFLRHNGCGVFHKGVKKKKQRAVYKETKKAEPQKAFHYGFAKYTNTGQRISIVMKITDDEAMELMEKRFI